MLSKKTYTPPPTPYTSGVYMSTTAVFVVIKYLFFASVGLTWMTRHGRLFSQHLTARCVIDHRNIQSL